jgi:hypothetical protein
VAQPGPARATGATTLATMHDLFCEPVFKNQKLPKTSTKSKISKSSCRWTITQQLSQRASYVLLFRLTGKTRRTCQFSRPQNTVHSEFNPVFGTFTLKIGMSANYEKCVPRNNKELLYWSILNFYSEILRTCNKTKSAFLDL